MTANKTFLVKRGEEILREYKTLAAARKLADAEGGIVYSGGELIYESRPVTAEIEAQASGISTYVLTHRMNIRTSPSLTAGRSGIAEKGTQVSVLKIEDDWLHLMDGTFIYYCGGKYASKL